MTAHRRRASLACAAVAALAASGWQALTIESNFGGDWTALYHTGEYSAVPPAIGDEQIHRFTGSGGYDAQYYHFIAHDPLILRGFEGYIDNPRMRYRRILVPGLASLLVAGSDDYVDSIYFLVLILSVLAGAWWVSRWSVECGLSAWVGLGFLLVPATLTSLDRATVDIALAALTAGFAVQRGPALYAVLAAAPLARESGALLVAAHVLATKRWKDAATLAPFLAWSGYVALRTMPDLTSHLSWIPFSGIAQRAANPVVYQLVSDWVRTAAVLDYLAFVGVCACMVLVWLRRDMDRVWLAAALFSIALVFVGHPQVWAEAYAFGRVASPLLLLVALIALRARWWWGFAPLALVLPRILWQLGPQFRGIIRALR